MKHQLRSAVCTEGRRMAGARALWVATGMKHEQFGKPIIAIVNSFTQFVPGHTHQKLILAETRFGSLALRTGLESNKGFTSQDMRNEQYVGKEGVAQTILRPAGKINIDGEILDATVEHGYVEPGEKVLVTKFENAQLFVRKMIQDNH